MAAFERMVRSSGDRESIGMYENLIEPPNVVNPDTGVPDWYGSDEEVWAEFQRQL